MQDCSSTSRSVLFRSDSNHFAMATVNSAALDSSVHGNMSAEPIWMACRKATSCSMMPELQSQSMSRL